MIKSTMHCYWPGSTADLLNLVLLFSRRFLGSSIPVALTHPTPDHHPAVFQRFFICFFHAPWVTTNLRTIYNKCSLEVVQTAELVWHWPEIHVAASRTMQNHSQVCLLPIPLRSRFLSFWRVILFRLSEKQNKTKHTKKPGKPFLVDSLRQATCVCVLSTVYALCCCQHRQGMPQCLGQGEETEAQWGWLPGSPPTGAPRRLLDASGTEACLALCLPHACQFDLRIFTFLLSQWCI